MMSPLRVLLDPQIPKYQPFGNIRSPNILHGFSRRDGKESQKVKVLLLACSDLRNMLEATSKSGIQNFVFHLNDCNPLNVARNVMMLKIISESKFNPVDQGDLNFLWDVWYNAKWPETTRVKFMVVLKDLLDGKLPDNVTIANQSSDFPKFLTIWSSWYLTCSKNETESNKLMRNVGMQRAVSTVETLLNENSTFSPEGQSFVQVLYELTDQYAAMWEGNAGTKDFNDRIRQKIREEARNFDREGLCRTVKVNYVCVNPTLLHPTTHRWIVQLAGFPFDGYFPLQPNEELDTSVKDQILIRFCQSKLKTTLSSYRQRNKDVKVFFHLGDDFEFCYSEIAEKFDVVYCSNIADHVGLANLINASSFRLLDTKEAMVLTQSMYWAVNAPNVKLYVEKELGCSLSMIPTMYGVRLMDRIELGSFAPDALRSPYSHSVILCWKKVPKFQNICLIPSPALIGCFGKLIDRCFSINGPLSVDKTDDVKEFDWAHFTPNTFNFIVDSISQRVEISSCLKQLKFPCAFDLARRTTEAWKNGQTVFKFSTKGLNSPLEEGYFELMKMIYDTKNCSRKLRLVLTPNNAELKTRLKANLVAPENFQSIISGPDVHFIDNFHLEILKTSEGETESARVSFLLPWDHCLIKPYSGLIFDLSAGFPIIIFESIKNLNVEKFQSPYPYHSPCDKPSGKFHMKMDGCIESEDGYTVKISTTCSIPNGMSVYSLRKFPSDSIHNVPIGLNEPADPKTLILSFPYPILVDKIHATVHHKDRLIDLELKKALFEPWPEDFQPQHLKWKVESLKPWKEGVGLKSVKNHIYSQRMPYALDSDLFTMSMVRSMIYSIFLKSQETKKEVYVSIQLKGAPVATGGHWLLRIHPPFLTSPQGSPMLLVSAMDFRQPQKRENQQKVQNDVHKIFLDNMNSANSLAMIATAEEMEIVRFVLRLNSTKITPTTWQKTNLQLEDDKPFMATFISPLYFDMPMSNDDYDKLLRTCGLSTVENVKCSSTGVRINGESCCCVCMKTSAYLKRCGKCRSVLYCSVECQRSHWPRHKVVCKSLNDAMSKLDV